MTKSSDTRAQIHIKTKGSANLEININVKGANIWINALIMVSMVKI